MSRLQAVARVRNAPQLAEIGRPIREIEAPAPAPVKPPEPVPDPVPSTSE
jgi:hypothetical protein